MHYLRRLNLKKHWISYLCSFLGVVSIIVWNNNKAHLVKRKDYGHFTDISQYYLGNAKIPFFFHAVDRHFFKEKTFEYAMDEVKKYSAQYIGRNPGHPNPDYPFASTTPTKSTLTPYFKTSDTLPNIVIIIAESLSSAFSGPTNYLGSYTPFLDSLSEHSLFWPNALSCAERSYGALPNILGSLPFGANERGLINEPALKELYYNTFISAYQNAYTSAFFYTGWGGFENTESFMKISGVNHTSTRDELQKRFPEEKEFGWGYRDVTMYKAGIEYISNLSGPHLSTFLTVSIHQPFDQEPENLSTEEYLTSKSYPYGKITNEKIASTIYQCDDAMKYFIQNLQSDPSYKNTIFIITGDHAIGGFVGQRSPLELFNVPLIIYSPLLTKGKTFWPVVTHRDILPSLLGLMNTNFDSPATANFAITGNQLDTASTFQSNVSTSLSLFLEEAPNYLEGRHFYFQGDAYEISDSLMNVKKIKNDTILNTLHDRMYEEKLLNSYVIDKDKLTLP